MTAASLAAETSDTAERRTLLREAEHSRFAVRASKRWRAYVLLPRAAAACKALVTEADAFFHKGGAIDPEHFVATLLPGLEIS